MTTYELAKRYLVVHANVMALGYEYRETWSKEFRSDKVDDFYNGIRSRDGYRHINPRELSKQELLSIGGAAWDGSGLVLLPLWMLFHLPDEIELTSITGETRVFRRGDIDNDERFGCLAYGIFCE